MRGYLAASRVEGDPAAMDLLQTSSRRYFSGPTPTTSRTIPPGAR